MAVARSSREAIFDVCIVGGGPAGAACALTLVTLGLDVLLVDRRQSRGSFADVLPPEAAPAIEKFGLAELFEPARGVAVPCIGLISNLNAAQPLFRAFGVAGGDRGWLLMRPAFDAALRARAAAAGCTVQEGAVCSIHREQRHWSIELRHDDRVVRVNGRFVVDASGRAASVARGLGARLRRIDKRIAWTGLWRAAGCDDERGVPAIEQADHGWVYSARLPDRSVHAAFHAGASSPVRKRMRSPADFLAALPEGSMALARLRATGRAAECDSFTVVDAGSARLSPMAGRGWIAVGDAACSFDPISGQGLANGLVSGFIGARAVADCLAGRRTALAVYEEAMLATHERTARLVANLYAAIAQPRPTPAASAPAFGGAVEGCVPTEDPRHKSAQTPLGLALR